MKVKVIKSSKLTDWPLEERLSMLYTPHIPLNPRFDPTTFLPILPEVKEVSFFDFKTIADEYFK